MSLTQFTLANCETFGDSPAYVNGMSGQAYTFRQVKSIVKNTASGLWKRGFRQGDVLAICCYNRPEYAFPFLAAPSVGGTVTMINPSYTAEEILFHLVDSGAKFVVTETGLHKNVLKAAEEVPGMKELFSFGTAEGCKDFGIIMNDDGEEFPTDIHIDPRSDIASLPYSSGTTGLPKGVMLTHYNLIANVLQITSENAWQISPGMRQLGLLPIFHAFGAVAVVLAGLRCGISSYFLPRFQPESFLETVQKYKLTHIHIVPPLVNFLLNHPIVTKYDLSSIHTVYCGAAPLGKHTCNN